MGLPELFIKQIHELLPDIDAKSLIDTLCTSDPSVSVRLNSSKCNDIPTAKQVNWCKRGYYFDERPQFTFDPALHAGYYYVQDASSMFLSYAIEQLIENTSPIRYLDLCAAPGGKTTIAIDALPSGSLIVANEIMPGRAQILRENIIKWGNPYCIVSNNDSSVFSNLNHFFDIVATDVPCSGEGMMRKDEEAVAQWSPALVNECATQQREIVDNAWKCLKPGGFLIYSTCTFNRKENEEIIEYMINEFGAESIDLKIPKEWNIQCSINSPIHGYHFFPHRTRGEGLFLAVVRKPEEEQYRPLKPTTKKKGKKESFLAIPEIVKNHVINNKSMTFTSTGDTINAFPTEYNNDISILKDYLHIILSGCNIATIKGKDFIPSHALALCSQCNKETFATYEVDYATAISYLRGETITIDAPRGYVLIKYNGMSLGFVKNLGNRANNLYPKEWRIKSSHIPSQPPHIL